MKIVGGAGQRRRRVSTREALIAQALNISRAEQSRRIVPSEAAE